MPDTTLNHLEWGELAAVSGSTFLLAAVAAATIRGPLLRVLRLVCGTDAAAEFWTTFWLVLVVTGPLTLVLAGTGSSSDMVDLVRRTLSLVGAGLVISFLAMGFAVSRSIPRRGAMPAVSEPSAPTEAAGSGEAS